MEITQCLLCDSNDLALAVEVPSMPIVDGYTKKPNNYQLHPANVMRCNECGHAQLSDAVPSEAMFRDYLFRTGDNPALVKHYRDYADWLTANFDTRYVIEIGCNDGTLLDMLPKSSRKLGIDPSNVPCSQPKIAEFLTPDTATQIAKDRGHAPLIIANHVFAHTPDMRGMMEAIRRLMTSRGTFIFEVAYAQDMLDYCLFDQIEHEHVSYHALQPLVRFLNRYGLEITQIHHNDCKGGSIRCVTQPIEYGDHPRFVEDCSLTRYQAFSQDIQDKRAALHNAIDGTMAIGYGAAAPCTSVIYQMALERKLRFLVDDNPRRHGLYSPHANLTVLPSSAIYDFDLPVVILAPRYAEAMKQKHKHFNHQFINPTEI